MIFSIKTPNSCYLSKLANVEIPPPATHSVLQNGRCHKIRQMHLPCCFKVNPPIPYLKSPQPQQIIRGREAPTTEPAVRTRSACRPAAGPPWLSARFRLSASRLTSRSQPHPWQHVQLAWQERSPQEGARALPNGGRGAAVTVSPGGCCPGGAVRLPRVPLPAAGGL